MKQTIVAALLVAITTTTFAQDYIVIERVGGKTTVVDLDNPGKSATARAHIKIDGETEPNPPGPPRPTDVVAQVKAWAAEVDQPVRAAALAKAYEEVGAKFAAGQMTWAHALEALAEISDEVLPGGRRGKPWDDFRTKLGNLIDNLRRGDKLTTPAQRSQFLADVAEGLGGSENAAIADPILRALLDALIEMVLQLIEDFLDRIGGGSGN